MRNLPPVQAAILAVGLIGFAIAFFTQFRLRHHVSADRVRELLGKPSDLYPNTIPPKRVLDERGRQLHRIMVIGGGLFVGACAALLLLNQALPQ
jgi:hypothetical protein